MTSHATPKRGAILSPHEKLMDWDGEAGRDESGGNWQILLFDADAEVEGYAVADGPGILRKQAVVPVDRRLGQDRREVLHGQIAVLAGAKSPRGAQSITVVHTDGRAWRMAHSRPHRHKCQWHIAVLRNPVFQTIQLIPNLEVVGAPPAALEERQILVELIVLIRIIRSEGADIRGGLRAVVHL